MRTAMPLLTVTVLSAGAPGRTSPDKAARQSSAQTDRRDRALRDGVARGRRNRSPSPATGRLQGFRVGPRLGLTPEVAGLEEPCRRSRLFW